MAMTTTGTGVPVDDARPNGGGTRSVLSYFRSYFEPGARARFSNHSTGLIARRLYELLERVGTVAYFGSKERPRGLDADLFVGHFWAFAELCAHNSFGTTAAFYSVSDPDETRRMLTPLAHRFGVPMPDWDLPPPSFDHERTMETADIVFVVGNSYTLRTFPARWHSKIVMLNYSIDANVFGAVGDPPPGNEFCYVATHCGLRKGFVDVVRTWSEIDPRSARLHVIGNLSPPYDRMLRDANNGSIVYEGWIDSDSARYREIIERCRFAFVPTYSEGQMGSLLELIHSGCVPITTAASGVDDRVLDRCVVVDPLDIEGQRAAIHGVLGWSGPEYRERRAALVAAVELTQTWASFDAGVMSALTPHLGPVIVR
jgi:glycosyltransferase involved in cell wall biosynthesis